MPFSEVTSSDESEVETPHKKENIATDELMIVSGGHLKKTKSFDKPATKMIRS